VAGDQGDRAAVIHLRHAEAAVLRRDLDAEATEFREAVDRGGGDLAGAVDLVRIQRAVEHVLDARQERVAGLAVRLGLQREGVDEFPADMALEQFSGVAGILPFRRTGVFRHVEGLLHVEIIREFHGALLP
jgi:hypothetical protein